MGATLASANKLNTFSAQDAFVLHHIFPQITYCILKLPLRWFAHSRCNARVYVCNADQVRIHSAMGWMSPADYEAKTSETAAGAA